MEPAEENRTRPMEENRDMEIGTDGEGVGAGGERGQRRLKRKENSLNTTS